MREVNSRGGDSRSFVSSSIVLYRPVKCIFIWRCRGAYTPALQHLASCPITTHKRHALRRFMANREKESQTRARAVSAVQWCELHDVWWERGSQSDWESNSWRGGHRIGQRLNYSAACPWQQPSIHTVSGSAVLPFIPLSYYFRWSSAQVPILQALYSKACNLTGISSYRVSFYGIRMDSIIRGSYLRSPSASQVIK